MGERTVVITGPNGKIGKLLCAELQHRGYQTIPIGSDDYKNAKKLDLSQSPNGLGELLAETNPSIIFHAAAASPRQNIINQLQNNTMMALNLTEAIATLPPLSRPLLVNLSSAAEVGQVSPDACPIKEDHPCNPISPYGIAKLCQTEIILSAARRHNFRTICARIFNIIGLPNSPELPVNSWVNQIKEMKSSGGSKVLRTGNLGISRDFIDADELIRILIDLTDIPSASGIINIASGIETPLLSIVEILKALSGIPFTIEQDSRLIRTNDIPRVVASTTRLTSLIGKQVPFNLRSSLEKMLTI